MTEKGVLEGKLSSLEVDICGLRDELRLVHQRREEQENELSELQQTSHSEISVLMNQLQDKSKAGIPHPLVPIVTIHSEISSVLLLHCISSIVPTLHSTFNPSLFSVASYLISIHFTLPLPYPFSLS